MHEGIKFGFHIPEILKEYEEERFCTKHGNYMANITEFDDGSVLASSCPLCMQEESEKEMDAELKEIQAENIEHCKACNIEPKFYDVTLDDFKPETKAQEFAKNAVREMIKSKSGKIVILGSNGVGKTMLGSITAKLMNGKIISMKDIALDIRISYTPKAEKTEKDIINELADIPFLCIDEVGREKNTEAVQNWFSSIIDKRYARNKPFMLLGNLHFKKDCELKGCPKCFENYFDNDVLSRLREDSSVIVIKAKDNRNNKTMKYYSD